MSLRLSLKQLFHFDSIYEGSTEYSDIISKMLEHTGLPADHPDVIAFSNALPCVKYSIIKSYFDAEALELVETRCAEWFGEIEALFPDPPQAIAKEVIRDAFCLGKIMGVYEPAWYLFGRDWSVEERDTRQYREWHWGLFCKLALLPETPTPYFWKHFTRKVFLGGKRFGCAERFSK